MQVEVREPRKVKRRSKALLNLGRHSYHSWISLFKDEKCGWKAQTYCISATCNCTWVAFWHPSTLHATYLFSVQGPRWVFLICVLWHGWGSHERTFMCTPQGAREACKCFTRGVALHQVCQSQERNKFYTRTISHSHTGECCSCRTWLTKEKFGTCIWWPW